MATCMKSQTYREVGTESYGTW